MERLHQVEMELSHLKPLMKNRMVLPRQVLRINSIGLIVKTTIVIQVVAYLFRDTTIKYTRYC
jgi:hypothetical protein